MSVVRGDTPEGYALSPIKILWDSGVVCLNLPHVAFFSGEVGGTGSESKPATLSIEETAGIPTGLAPDIEAQIQKRRARKPPPDDLAG